MVTTTSTPAFTLARAPESPLDPPPVYAALRGEQPVSRVSIWNGDLDVWLVTRWEDVRTVLGSPSFSTDAARDEFPIFFQGAPPTPPGFFQTQDAPVHTTMRRALTREFMVKRIDALRPSITAHTDALIDTMLVEHSTSGGAPVDLVEAFALPLPSLVICDLLGVPYEDHDYFQQNSKVLVDFRSTIPQAVEARDNLSTYLRKLIERKGAEPGDDLLTRLRQQVDAGSISLDDAADLSAFLLLAGHETTANMIALSVIALLRSPDQIPQLFAGPAELASGVEELLRYLTIVHSGLRRQALEDVVVGGVTIKAGDGVIISTSAANRDPDVFNGPDRLDLARENSRQHVAFGYGVHQCLGQPLARAELQIVLPALFERLPDLALAMPFEDIAFKQSAIIYGVHELRVTW